jgi:hypothetical protein
MVAALAIEASIGAMGKLTEAVTESVAFYDDAQKASLTLGMNYSTATDRLGSSMDGLGGTIKDKLSGGFEILDAGFQGNIEEMSHVVNQMKLLGQDTKGLHKLNQSLGFSLGMNSQEIGSLDSTLLDTSRRYGVSMEKMVSSLDGLKESFPILLASGAKTNGNLVAAVGKITAGMGAQDKGMVNQFVNKLFKSDADTLKQLTALGMVDDVNAMFSGDMSIQETQKTLMRLVEKGGSFYDSFNMEGLAGYGRSGISASIGSKELTEVAKVIEIAMAKPRQINTEEIDSRNTLSNKLAETFDLTRFGDGLAKSMTGGHAGDPTYVSITNPEGKAGTQAGTQTGTQTGTQSKSMVAVTIERELNPQKNQTDPNTSILRDIADGVNKTNQLTENGTSNNNFNNIKQNIKALSSPRTNWVMR